MRIVTAFVITLGISLLGAGRAVAQDLELPELTTEEQLDVLAFNFAATQAALVALGSEHGMTPEEVGAWTADFFSSGWVGGLDAAQVAWRFSRNHLAWPGATAEVVSSSAESASIRLNHPEDAFWGAGGRMHGVAGDDIRTTIRALFEVLADRVGADITLEPGDDHDVLRMTTRYDPITASNDLRWARSGSLSWLTWMQLLQLRMADGLTAAEIGAADAEFYAPTWSASTPYRFYRGMMWNAMQDPDYDCETLSASQDEVRARCRVHYREIVERNQERFGVTVQDVFDSGRAFGEGVADYLGFVWTETLEGDYRMIEVRRK